MKNLLKVSFVLVIVLTLALMMASCTVEEKDPTDVFSYTEIEGGYSISGFKGEDGDTVDLVIPSQYNGKAVVAIADNAFSRCDSIKSVVIPDSITTIGINAFYVCDSLESVTLSNNLTYFGGGAFIGCPKLQYNQYENGYYLGSAESPYMLLVQFNSNTDRTVKINNAVKFIGYNAFSQCENVESVSLPNGTLQLSSSAFQNCNKLKNVYIPSTVTYVEDNAFYGCGIETINCGAASKPDTWSDLWLNSRSEVTVNWGR